jgi:hypothetical protein
MTGYAKEYHGLDPCRHHDRWIMREIDTLVEAFQLAHAQYGRGYFVAGPFDGGPIVVSYHTDLSKLSPNTRRKVEKYRAGDQLVVVMDHDDPTTGRRHCAHTVTYAVKTTS